MNQPDQIAYVTIWIEISNVFQIDPTFYEFSSEAVEVHNFPEKPGNTDNTDNNSDIKLYLKKN